MKGIRAGIIVSFLCITSAYQGKSQCQNTFAVIFGSLIDSERGYSLASSPDGAYIYLGGIKNDSALILKMSFEGVVQWTRTFDIVPGREDHIHKLLVDAEGMIGVAGTAGSQTNGGTVFAFRYNPDSNIILWAKEYISTSTNYCLGMVEATPGGNYLMSNNPSSPNVAELIMLDRSTGNISSGFSKHYDLGTSESIFDFDYHSGFLYATGRFSDGGSVAEMRNTILKIDPNNGTIEWMRLGHRNGNEQARLYGFDLVIIDDEIYSVYLGDPAGTNLDATLIYLQKTTLNGDLVWLKEFNLPGTNDWVDEIMESNGDLIILARNRVSPSNMILFKTDTDGTILWSNEYDFSINDNATPIGSIQSQLIEVNDHYFFTAYAEGTGLADMILVKTDLEGQLQDTCLAVRPISIEATTVADPVFYERTPMVSDYTPQQYAMTVSRGTTSSLVSVAICSNISVTGSFVQKMICMGDMFEGYADSGVYRDTFSGSSGCDSIRVVELEVVPNYFSTIDVDLCHGDGYEGYFDSGIYVDTLMSVYGCDSIRSIDLQVQEEIVTFVETNTCSEDSGGHQLPGTYIDTLTSSAGCDSIRTLVLAGASRFIPNVFSPNQDNINDIFEVFTFPDSQLALTYFVIFDRMGNMVYESRNWPIRWDGKDNRGRYYNPAVFTYLLKYICGHEEVIEPGNITLIR